MTGQGDREDRIVVQWNRDKRGVEINSIYMEDSGPSSPPCLIPPHSFGYGVWSLCRLGIRRPEFYIERHQTQN
jgi:hypothetical protein